MKSLCSLIFWLVMAMVVVPALPVRADDNSCAPLMVVHQDTWWSIHLAGGYITSLGITGLENIDRSERTLVEWDGWSSRATGLSRKFPRIDPSKSAWVELSLVTSCTDSYVILLEMEPTAPGRDPANVTRWTVEYVLSPATHGVSGDCTDEVVRQRVTRDEDRELFLVSFFASPQPHQIQTVTVGKAYNAIISTPNQPVRNSPFTTTHPEILVRDEISSVPPEVPFTVRTACGEWEGVTLSDF